MTLNLRIKFIFPLEFPFTKWFSQMLSNKNNFFCLVGSFFKYQDKLYHFSKGTGNDMLDAKVSVCFYLNYRVSLIEFTLDGLLNTYLSTYFYLIRLRCFRDRVEVQQIRLLAIT